MSAIHRNAFYVILGSRIIGIISAAPSYAEKSRPVIYRRHLLRIARRTFGVDVIRWQDECNVIFRKVDENEIAAVVGGFLRHVGDIRPVTVPFAWNNNYRIRESQILTLTTADHDGDGVTYEKWIAHEWTRSPVVDIDEFLAPFYAEAENDPAISIDADVPSAERAENDGTVIREAVVYTDRFGMRWRERSIYPGIYDNVARLRDWLRNPTGDDHAPVSVDVDADEIISALSMILAHDQGERDARAPEGYCRHGVYVGGCGIDWMCGACEAGEE